MGIQLAEPGDHVAGRAHVLPGRAGWEVLRPRLVERLRKGTRGPLTVVTGPPGAGKTVAVSQWAASDDASAAGRVIRLSCDDIAETADGLACRLAMAVRDAAYAHTTVRPAGEDSLAAVPGADLDRTAAFLAGLDPPVILVLDGFRAERDALIAEGVGHLLRRAGAGLRVILVSRSTAPMPLNRHRLAGELTEIGAADLALHEREAAAVLARHGVRLGGAALRALCERTGGWAAGIRLAALVMQGDPAPEAYARRFGGDDHTVVDYVREEVLDALPPLPRRLLLAAGATDRFTADLTARLAGEEAARAFAGMVRDNSFIVPLGQGWYGLHPVFGQALRTVLWQESPAEAREAHRRAAGWFDRNGLPTEAVGQAVLAADWRYASWLAVHRMVIGQVLGLRPDRDLSGCFEDMPQPVIGGVAEPEPAIVAAATALAHGRGPRCAELLGHARAVLSDLPGDQAPAVRSSMEAVEQALSGCMGPTVAGGAWTGLTGTRGATGRTPDDGDGAPEDHPELRALFLLSQGTGRLNEGDLSEASRVLTEAVAAAAGAGCEAQRRICLGRLALTEALLGRFSRAADLAARATRATRPPQSSERPAGRGREKRGCGHGAGACGHESRGHESRGQEGPGHAGRGHGGRGGYEACGYEACGHGVRGHEDCGHTGCHGQTGTSTHAAAAAHLAAAWAGLERCDFAAAHRALERADQALADSASRARADGLLPAVLPLVRARLDLAQGRPHRALETLRPWQATEQQDNAGDTRDTRDTGDTGDTGDAGAGSGPGWLRPRLALTLCEALTATGNTEAAPATAGDIGSRHTLESAVALIRSRLRTGDTTAEARAALRRALRDAGGAPIDLRVEAWLLDAHLSYLSGDGQRGRRSLDQALRLGGREQISLPFLRTGEWLRAVLRRDPELAGPHQRLLGPIRLAPTPASTSAADAGTRTGTEQEPVTVERLSARELDVLRHLAEMMTTEEIAVELCLSLNTVKTHLKSIYRKLGVTRRGEAVRRARRLSLL